MAKQAYGPKVGFDSELCKVADGFRGALLLMLMSGEIGVSGPAL